MAAVPAKTANKYARAPAKNILTQRISGKARRSIDRLRLAGDGLQEGVNHCHHLRSKRWRPFPTQLDFASS
jgi:hypothetical protein